MTTQEQIIKIEKEMKELTEAFKMKYLTTNEYTSIYYQKAQQIEKLRK
jgi:hypothetical protein